MRADLSRLRSTFGEGSFSKLWSRLRAKQSRRFSGSRKSMTAGSSTQRESFTKGASLACIESSTPRSTGRSTNLGHDTPGFKANDLTFGIVICRDSTYREPARAMADCGATVLFVPTNNCMSPWKGGVGMREQARETDIARATENRVSVIRADVAGRASDLVSYGSSGIVDRDGTVLQTAKQFEAGLVVAEIETSPMALAQTENWSKRIKN